MDTGGWASASAGGSSLRCSPGVHGVEGQGAGARPHVPGAVVLHSHGGIFVGVKRGFDGNKMGFAGGLVAFLCRRGRGLGLGIKGLVPRMCGSTAVRYILGRRYTYGVYVFWFWSGLILKDCFFNIPR